MQSRLATEQGLLGMCASSELVTSWMEKDMYADLANRGIARESERVPFNDLTAQWQEIADDVRFDLETLFERSAFSAGPFVKAFEDDIAAYLGVRHAIAVNSGTSALHLATLAADIGPGDEVLVPSHTFIATLWGLLYAGATPVLCDVDEATATIDVADAQRRVTPRTKAIIPVHLYGQPADMGAVLQLAERFDLKVIEDNAQAIGARWKNTHLGTIGGLGCFSFYPGKNLGAAGEGGLVVTNDDELAARVRCLGNHGQRERYVHTDIGFNYRMDGVQGAILSRKLKRLDAWTERRRQLAARFQAGLAGLPLELPVVRFGDHVWHLFVVRTPRRKELREHLARANIETGLHYPIPCHRQPCLQHLQMDRNSYPQSDRWTRELLSLPLFYGMTDAQVDRVIDSIHEFFRS
jgi:dTDP-4-amino-4,6-dideoxygalactose transaminase